MAVGEMPMALLVRNNPDAAEETIGATPGGFLWPQARLGAVRRP